MLLRDATNDVAAAVGLRLFGVIIDLVENENAAVLVADRSAAKRSVDTITFVWRRLLLIESEVNFME
jgi:hypothetical protein